MARATFVKAAQKDIYRHGKYVSYESKKGKRAGKTLSKLDRTVARDEEDTVYIAKGESYYWWAFLKGGKHFSKTKPKRSQLTQSDYLSQIYDFEDDIDHLSASDFSDASELEAWVDDLKSSLEELRDQQEESKSNMPESLQESPTGELLQERYETLENAVSELEGIDATDYEEPDEDDIRDELKDNVDFTSTEEQDEDENFDEDEEKKKLVSDDDIQFYKDEQLSEWLDEKISEIQNISLS